MAIITKSVARYTKVGDKTSPKVNYLTQLALGYADTEDGKPERTPAERKGNPVPVVE